MRLSTTPRYGRHLFVDDSFSRTILSLTEVLSIVPAMVWQWFICYLPLLALVDESLNRTTLSLMVVFNVAAWNIVLPVSRDTE